MTALPEYGPKTVGFLFLFDHIIHDLLQECLHGEMFFLLLFFLN